MRFYIEKYKDIESNCIKETALVIHNYFCEQCKTLLIQRIA